jgi:hypothetical protein
MLPLRYQGPGRPVGHLLDANYILHFRKLFATTDLTSLSSDKFFLFLFASSILLSLFWTVIILVVIPL